MEPRYNEGPSYWQNLFAITRFRYIEVLFHIFYCYWGKENCSLYWGFTVLAHWIFFTYVTIMTLFPQNQMDPQVQEAIQMIVKLRSSEQFCWQYYLNVTAGNTVKAWQLRVGDKVVRLPAFMTQGDWSLQARMLPSLACNWNHKPMCVKRAYSQTVLRILVPYNLDFIHYLCKYWKIYQLIKLFTYFPHFITHYRWREYERFTREHTCNIALLPWDFLNITSQKKKRQGIFLFIFRSWKRNLNLAGNYVFEL